MKTSHMLSIRLHLEPNPNGVYTVTSPDAPGLATEACTPEEILRNVQEALQELMAAWQERGMEPPPALRKPGQVSKTMEILVAV